MGAQDKEDGVPEKIASCERVVRREVEIRLPR
jgi:hypothetical protein